MTNGEVFAEELEEHSRNYLENYALCASRRKEELGITRFRDHELTKPLEYRTEYHRDRDRIIWSKAFKRLQHKTQIFPHYAEDHYRRRLTHSIEVAQIATTIARALKLNEVAVEAMALGHDLGHTPFGHSGEDALNKVTSELIYKYFPDSIIRKSVQGKLKDLALRFKVPIYGFDHCSHSIEVISRLEKCKVGDNFEFGLNLTYDVKEGILKHIYNLKYKEEENNFRPYSCLENILKLDMYKEYNMSYGSMEAQCVWISDKLSYLISDIEDGCRCNALDKSKVSESALFEFINEKYYLLRNEKRNLSNIITDDDISDFLRNYLLPTIIINIIENSKVIIRNAPILAYEDVIHHPNRIVYYNN